MLLRYRVKAQAINRTLTQDYDHFVVIKLHSEPAREKFIGHHRRNSRVVLFLQENLEKLLGLEKKIVGLIMFVSSDSQFIKDGQVVEVDPRNMRTRLTPIKRNEKKRHLFLVSFAHSTRSYQIKFIKQQRA